jgi:hypothetical protein
MQLHQTHTFVTNDDFNVIDAFKFLDDAVAKFLETYTLSEPSLVVAKIRTVGVIILAGNSTS